MSKSTINLWLVFWPVQILALLGVLFTTPNWLYLFMGWVIFCGFLGECKSGLLWGFGA